MHFTSELGIYVLFFQTQSSFVPAGVSVMQDFFKQFFEAFPGGTVVKNRLPMQGTRVRSLVQEDPTSRGATKPMCDNYWAHMPQLLKPVRLEPVLRNKRSHSNEKPAHHNEDPRSPQLEKVCEHQQRPNAAQNK